jgi:hypothetical protein
VAGRRQLYSLMRIPKNLPGQKVAKLVPLQVALQLLAVPLAMEEGLLTVAMASPDDRESIDALMKASGHQIFPVWSPPDQIEAALQRLKDLCDD